MAKNSSGTSLIIVAVVFLIIGWFGHQFFGDALTQALKNIPAQLETKTNEEPKKEDTGTMCAQVVTPARNPKTGDIKEFPTPCDVPEGWVVIENDVPGL